MALFRERFPALADMLAADIQAFESRGEEAFPFAVAAAKNGEATAVEAGVPLHSKYNPGREAVQQVSVFSAEQHAAGLFLGFGLGFAPAVFARQHPDVPLVLVEPDPAHLFAAFCVTDWQDVLRHGQLVFAVKASAASTAALLAQYKSSALCTIAVPAWQAHAKDFFEEVGAALRRSRQKEEINTNTLEKFAHLWLSNSCRNLHFIAALDGVDKFRGAAAVQQPALPFIVLAAGPSLATVLPHLAALKERAVLICVDTALHSCLSAGVEPDFIVLVDPQYACAMHLEFLASPSSLLITESAAWPSVFRFPCKEIVLCSSLFPIGQYFEKQLGSKGRLGAGGSVTTTAWDFARSCGAQEIYIAGMDLGFPGGQTHIRGSQFEERAHRLSGRLHTAENSTADSLMSAHPAYAKDYHGNPLLTDSRMSVFAWWFESNCAQAQADAVQTYTLTPQSLAIEGIQVAAVTQLLERPAAPEAKAAFFRKAEERAAAGRAAREAQALPSYDEVLRSFLQNLETLSELARKGLQLCEKGIRNRLKAPQVFPELERIDRQILCSGAKEAAALVFPTERHLKELSADLPQEPQLRSLCYSRLIYTELLKAVQEYRNALGQQ